MPDYVCFYCLRIVRDVPGNVPNPICCQKPTLQNDDAVGFTKLFDEFTDTTAWTKDVNSFMDPTAPNKIVTKGWIGDNIESHERLEAWLKKTTSSDKKKINAEELLKGEIEYRKLKQLFQNDFANLQKNEKYKDTDIDNLITPYLAAFTQYYMHNATHRPPSGHGKVQNREYDKPLLYFRSQVDHPTGTGDSAIQLKNKAQGKFVTFPAGPPQKQGYRNIYAGFYTSNANIPKPDLLKTKDANIPHTQTNIKIEDYYNPSKAQIVKNNQQSFLANNLSYRNQINQYLSICGTRYANFKVFTSKGHPNLYIQLNNPPFSDKDYDPTKTNHTEGWINVILSFLGGLLNFLCSTAHTNIKVIRRQSFGFNRPTLTDAGRAVRLSLGNQPPSFAFIVESALEILDQVICLIEEPIALAGLSPIENSRSSMATTDGANVFRYAVRSEIEQLNLFENAEQTINRFLNSKQLTIVQCKSLGKKITDWTGFEDNDSDLELDKLTGNPEERAKAIQQKLAHFSDLVRKQSETQKKYLAKENPFSQAFNHYLFKDVILDTLQKPISNREMEKYVRLNKIFNILTKSSLFNEYKNQIVKMIGQYDLNFSNEINKVTGNSINLNTTKEITKEQMEARKTRIAHSMEFTGYTCKTEIVKDKQIVNYEKTKDSPFELNRWPLIHQLDAIVAHLIPKMHKWSEQYKLEAFQECYKYAFQKVHNNIEKGKYLINEFKKLRDNHKDQIFINIQGHFYAKAVNVIETLLENVIIIKSIHKMRKALNQGMHTKTSDQKERLKVKFCTFYNLNDSTDQVKFFHAEGGQAAVACAYILMAKIIFGKMNRDELRKATYVESPYFEVWDFLSEQDIFTATDIEQLTSKTEIMTIAEHKRYTEIRKKIEEIKPDIIKKSHKAQKTGPYKITKKQKERLLAKIGTIENDVDLIGALERLVTNNYLTEEEKTTYIKLQAKHDLYDKKIILTDASPALTVYPAKDKFDINLVEYLRILDPDTAMIVDVTNSFLFGEKIKALINEWKLKKDKYLILVSSLLKHEQLGLDKYQAGRIIILCPSNYKNIDKHDATVLEELAGISDESFHSLSHSYLNLLQDLLYPDSNSANAMEFENTPPSSDKIIDTFRYDDINYKITKPFNNLAHVIIHAANHPDIKFESHCIKAYIDGIRQHRVNPKMDQKIVTHAEKVFSLKKDEDIKALLEEPEYFLFGISLFLRDRPIIYFVSNDGSTITSVRKFPEPQNILINPIYILNSQNKYFLVDSQL